MGFLDRLTGRPQKGAHEPEEPQHEPTTSGISTSEILRDSSRGLGAMQGEPSSRLYDPYEGISTAIGGKKAVFQLPEGPEFVFQEDTAVHRRGWGSVMYYSGIGYLGGGTAGFAIGGYKYLQAPQDPTFNTMKLKANRLINTAGSLGRRMACGSATLGLYFAISENLISSFNDGRLPDEVAATLAGFVTASLYRSPRGPRLAAVAGLVGAVAGAGLAAARHEFPSL